MAKFPDPTKEYQGAPIEKPMLSESLPTDKFIPPSPPQPPKAEEIKPESPPSPPQKTPPSPSPFRNLLPLILGILIFGVLAFLVVRFLIPALSGKDPEPVTLTYWGLWEPQSVMQVAISEYERLNPHIKINYTMQSPKSYRTRLTSAISQGQGPDIARVHNTWVLSMLGDYLAPAPSDIIPPEELNSFYPVVARDFSSGGKIYGLPLMIDGLALYYNEDILARTGEPPPTDWNALRKLAFQLTSRNAETGIIESSGVSLGTTGNIDHWSDILGLLLLQNSADPGKPSSQEAQDALAFYTIFTTQDRVWDTTQPNNVYAFATQSLAMMLAPSWQASEVKAINPNLKFKVVPAPTLPGSEMAWATYWGEVVPTSSKNQEEAWKFLKFLSSRETLQKLYAAETQLRTYGEPYPRIDMANLLSSDPVMGAFVTQAPRYVSWYMSDKTEDEGINDQISKYYEDAVNAIGLGSSVQAVIDTLAQGVQQVLTKFSVTPN